MLTELFCRGADNAQRTFYLELPAHLESWPLRVRVHRSNPPDPKADGWFSLTLDRLRDGLIVAEMNHNQKPWYSRKGIGDALLPEMARITGLRICSSSNTRPEYPNEYRSVSAGALWLRLLQEDIATYLPDEDRFFLPQHTASAELDSAEIMTAAVRARPSRPLAVFPGILPVRYTTGRVLPLQSDDINSKSDLDELVRVLYDHPEWDVYIYVERGKTLTPFLEDAGREGALDLNETSFYFYKHPAARSRRDYLQITPADVEVQPEDRSDAKYLIWQKAIVAVGPMYGRIPVRLTARMQRSLELQQFAEMRRAADPHEKKRRIHIDEIASFQLVRAVSPADVAGLLKDGYLNVSEDQIQTTLERILHVPEHKKDWSGEINDLYTANLVIDTQRVETAFLLKGNGLRKKKMEIADCGANGDQLVRLVDSPARLFVVQFVGTIAENVIRDIDAKVAKLRSEGIRAAYCIIDGQDTARLLRAYGEL